MIKMKKWLQEKSNRMYSVKNKLLSIFLVILLIPTVLTGLYLATEIRQNLINTKTMEIERNNERIERDIINSLTPIIRVSDWIYQDNDLVELVTHHYQSNYEVYHAYKNYEIFDDYLRYYPDIQHIRFYVNNHTLTDSTGVYYANPEIVSASWYQDAVESKGLINWIQLIDPVTGKEQFTLVRSVYENYQLVGVLLIAVSDKVFEDALADSNNHIFITVGQQNPVFSHPKFDEIDKEYNQFRPLINELLTTEQEENTYPLNNDININSDHEGVTLNLRNIAIPKRSQDNVSIVSVIPTNVIVSEVNKDLMRSFLMILFLFFICFILLAFFIRSFNHRIDALKNSMSKVANGDFDIPPKISGRDEISEVYNHLYATMKSLQTLISENYEHLVQEKNMEIQQRETQFKALSSQINPHFLYNTLEMIRMKALKNKDKEVADIVKILSKLMRKTLENNTKEAPMSEELSFTEMYLEIQQLRFGEEKIFYQIDQNTLNDYLVIPLIIQPIVENSFIHGIEPKEGRGEISIVVNEDEENLHIEIKDNGTGIKVETLNHLKNILNKEEDSDRIGLNNVNQRIKYMYGKEFGLSIDSIEGIGTVVEILLPKRLEKQEENNHV